MLISIFAFGLLLTELTQCGTSGLGLDEAGSVLVGKHFFMPIDFVMWRCEELFFAVLNCDARQGVTRAFVKQ